MIASPRSVACAGLALVARVGLALVALLAMAACDDDASRPGDDALTDGEAVALVKGLAQVGRLTDTDAGRAGEPTLECPLGGVVGFTGSVTIDSTATTQVLHSTTVMTPQDCRFVVDGVTFTANGAPAVHQTGDVTITGFFEQIEMEFDVGGAVDWETGSPARQGTCALDLDLVGEIELPGVESTDTTAVVRGTLSGTACEVAVDLSLDALGSG